MGDVTTLPCVSFRQPYASLILNGVKTVESRWTAMFSSVRQKIVAVHVAWRQWEGSEWNVILKEQGMTDEQIAQLTALPNGMMRGQVVGKVPCVTWNS